MEEIKLEDKKTNSLWDRIQSFDLSKGWMWLLYLDLVLPLCLFLLAYGLKGVFLSKLFHTYNLFIINPIPTFTGFTGIIGLLLHIGAVVNALRKKDWRDALICVGIAILLFLYFFFEVNYMLSYHLTFI